MELQNTRTIENPSMEVVHKRHQQDLFLEHFKREMKSLLKIIGMRSSLVAQEHNSESQSGRLMDQMTKEVSKAQRLLCRFEMLCDDETNTSNRSLTEVTPRNIFQEVMDRSGIAINLAVQNEKTLRFMADHELLVESLIVLIQHIVGRQNSLVGICIYQRGAHVIIKMDFLENLAPELESAIALHYVFKNLRMTNAVYTREKNYVMLKLRKSTES